MISSYIILLVSIGIICIGLVIYNIYCILSISAFKKKIRNKEYNELDTGCKLNIYLWLIKRSKKIKECEDSEKYSLINSLSKLCYSIIISLSSSLITIAFWLFAAAIALYVLDSTITTVSTTVQAILGEDDDCVCYAKCAGNAEDDKKSVYELLFGTTEYDKLINSMYNSLTSEQIEEFDTINKGTDGKKKSDFIRSHINKDMIQNYKSIVGNNKNFRSSDGLDRTTMSDDELRSDLIALLCDYKVNGRNPSCGCSDYSTLLLDNKCMGMEHYKEGWTWENLWESIGLKGSSQTSYGYTPGNATGTYALELNDGTYYWYHQNTELCNYNVTDSEYGRLSSIYPGGTDKGNMAQRGCGIYSTAIALSNLLGEEITPYKVIEDVMKCNINLDSVYGNYYFYSTTSNGISYNGSAPVMSFTELAQLINNAYGNKGVVAEVIDFKQDEVDKYLCDDTKYAYIINSWSSSDSSFTWTTSTGGHFMVIRGKDSDGKYYCFTSARTRYGSTHDQIRQGMNDGLEWSLVDKYDRHDKAIVIYRDKSYYVTESTENDNTSSNENNDSLVAAYTFDFTKGGNFECPYNNCYTFMGWQMVKSKSSPQYIWRQSIYPDWVNGSDEAGSDSAFDSEGFGKVGDRYVVAVTRRTDGGIAEVGEKIDVYLENGEVIKCIVGDIKSSGDSTWTKWGHLTKSSVSTIEFIVNRNNGSTVKWYKNGKGNHANAGTASCHPEWKSNISKIIVLKDDVESSTGDNSSTNTEKTIGQEIVNYACQFVGNHYVYGGTTINCSDWTDNVGIDCSGFTMKVYAQFGISIPHSSRLQRSCGRAVSESEIQPGDIVCYDGHVAIYIGDGKIVHASSKKNGIKIGNDYKYKKVLAIRRLIE